jgi:hypothetical protein
MRLLILLMKVEFVLPKCKRRSVPRPVVGQSQQMAKVDHSFPCLTTGMQSSAVQCSPRLLPCKQQEKEQAPLAAWRLIEPRSTRQKCIAPDRGAIENTIREQ